MKTVPDFQSIPANSPRADKQANGTWLVYEPGDTLPVQPAPGPAPRIVSVLDFRKRFTDLEIDGVLASADVAVRRFMFKLTTRTEVDMDDPQVTLGLNLLVARTLLTAPRRAVVGA